MNKRLTEIYRSCRPKEALASQDEYKSANALLGSEVENFAMSIVQECIDIISPYTVRMGNPGEEYLHPIQEIKEHFGVEE